MRIAVSFVAGVALLLFASAAFGSTQSTKAVSSANGPAKGAPMTVPNPVHIDQGGDTIASALPIPSLPFSDSGTTSGYVDNYAPNCGFAGGAPDVVYSYSPAANGTVGFSLCGSAYDTELYVFQDVAGNIIACNDDSCGLQSELNNISVLAGHTYYIVVDGYGSSNGPYRIISSIPPVPCVTCPAGALIEGEPVCGDNYYDSFNGGCNSVPPVFQPLPFQDGLQVCGEYGGFLYAGLSYRDTDWYEVHAPVAGFVSWTVKGETDTLCGIINGNSGCPVSSFYAYAYGARCIDHTASAVLSVGTWWLWAGTLNFGSLAGPCGQSYLATLHCAGIVAVEPASWGKIKDFYK